MELLFEAVSEFSEEKKQIVRSVLAGLVLQHSARRLDTPRAPTRKQAEPVQANA